MAQPGQGPCDHKTAPEGGAVSAWKSKDGCNDTEVPSSMPELPFACIGQQVMLLAPLIEPPVID